jgi:hypothetical protein
MRSVRLAAFSALLIAAAPRLARADAEGDLRAQWQGAYVVTRAMLLSECTDHFTENEVSGGRVTGGGGGNVLRFAPGEIADIDKVEVTWTRIDVSLTFLEPFRVTWKDGPYTLYDQRRCRAKLRFDLPRDVRKDAAKASAAISALLEAFPNEGAARHTASYNKRRVEAFPADWERTKAEYDVWRASRVNAKVQEKIDTVLREGQDAINNTRDDDEYQRCFGRGVRSRSYQTFGSCELLLDSYFIVNGSCKNQRGFEDGQHLAWTVGMVRALGGCFVPAPGH